MLGFIFKIVDKDGFSVYSVGGVQSSMLFDSSWGASSLIPDGSTPQISVAYSIIVRSLENLPEAAMLRRHMLAHSKGFRYSSLTLCWHSMYEL